MARVTRPGGRVVVLEITTPQKPPLSLVLPAWFDRVVPLLGRLAGDPDAYTYLPQRRRASRARASWRRDGGAGSTTCAGSSPPAGSSPSTRARRP
jgi:ubiquinone/menaquinone biosynthesis C-methylase UbiE